METPRSILAGGVSNTKPRGHFLADRHRRRQPWALNAEQAHQSPHAVINHEIAWRFARPMQLRSDAGVVGLKRAFGEAGPEAAHGCVEARRTRRIDSIILVVNKLQVRTKAGDASEIAPIVRAQCAGNW